MRFDRLSYKVVVAYEISRRYFALVTGSGKAEKETKRYDWAPKRKRLLPGTNKKVATARRKNNQNAKEHVLIVRKNEKKLSKIEESKTCRKGEPPPRKMHTRAHWKQSKGERAPQTRAHVHVFFTPSPSGPSGRRKGFPILIRSNFAAKNGFPVVKALN